MSWYPDTYVDEIRLYCTAHGIRLGELWITEGAAPPVHDRTTIPDPSASYSGHVSYVSMGWIRDHVPEAYAKIASALLTGDLVISSDDKVPATAVTEDDDL